MSTVRILFLSAEVNPFSKVGGLGDVAGSLPRALESLGHDVRIVTPAYRATEEALRRGGGPQALAPVRVPVRDGTTGVEAGVLEDRLPDSEVPVYLLAHRPLYDRERVYGYEDDPYRFAFLCRGAFELLDAIGWKPEILHAHDWHAAPAVAWLALSADSRFAGMPTVFSIHNLSHQGHAPTDTLAYLRLLARPLPEERLGEVNFMARGIWHADTVSTVSPTYAREILSPEGGGGLDGLLRQRRADLRGIVNGLDTAEWNASRDLRLPRTFDAGSLDGRAENKRALQKRAGLPLRDHVPVVAMVTRLERQKGLEITGQVLHQLLNGTEQAQVVVLGSGAPEYAAMLRHIAGYHRRKMACFLDVFDNDLAHLIYGGADLFLMPSLFEPCGLSQLIAMRYGCVPVVRTTGGLADTVSDGVTGFAFAQFTAEAFWRALSRALRFFREAPEAWRTMQRSGMAADRSWEHSALQYVDLYRDALSRRSRATRSAR
jgi:starch synthase